MGFLSGLFGGDKVTTDTSTIGAQDAAHIQGTRDAGVAAADAARNTQIAGLDPRYGGVDQQLGDQYGRYGQLADQYGQMGQSALNFGSQTGLGELSRYMNPMMAQYMQGMDPVYQQQMAQAMNLGNQMGSGPGQAFGQNERSALFQSEMRGGINRAQGADYGNRYFQSAQQGAGMLMDERQRMLGYGQNMANLGMGALGQQRGLTQDQFGSLDYQRNVQNQQYGQPAVNAANAAQMMAATQGQNIESTRTNTEEGPGFLGGLLSAAMPIASMLIPGGPAILGGLSALGGSGSGPSSSGGSPISNYIGGGGGGAPSLWGDWQGGLPSQGGRG